MSDYEKAVFISYAWGEETHEREAIVNQLDQSLQKRGLKIIRDKRDLGYKGRIRQFMERIGEGDCVIVVLSDKYLRSKNCMYELVEIAENKDFINRVFPVVLSDAKIYDAMDRIAYKKYWKQKKEDLNKEILSLGDVSNITGIAEELDDYDRFGDEFDKLTTIFKNMNTLSPDMLREADFQQLYDALVDRMSVTWTKSKAINMNTKPTPKKEKKIMDPVTLAAAATTLLVPFVKKAGEFAIDKLSEKLPESIGKVWDEIAVRFKGNAAASGAAEDLAKNAEDEDNRQAFELQLKKALKDSEEFSAKLTELLESAKKEAGVSIVGDGVVAINNSNAVKEIKIDGDNSGDIIIGNRK